MKKLLLIAALVSTPAFADSWAMPNQAGGEIVLTDRPCPGYKKLLAAYNYSSGGRTQTICTSEASLAIASLNISSIFILN